MSQAGDGEDTTVSPKRDTPGEIGEVELEALKCYLRDALKHRLLSRGVKEVIKSLIREEASMCILVDSCPAPQYVKIVELLCRDKSVPLIRMSDPAKLGELSGLCPVNRKGESSKVIKCNSVVVKKGDIEDSSEKVTVLKLLHIRREMGGV